MYLRKYEHIFYIKKGLEVRAVLKIEMGLGRWVASVRLG